MTNEALYDSTQNVGLIAVPLNARLVITEVLIQADPDNEGIVYVGNADSQSIVLDAGDVEGISIDETSKVYVRGSAEWQQVNWHALGK